MATHQLNVDEAKAHFPDLIEAAINGEEVFITRDDQPVLKIVRVESARPRPKFGSAKGMVTIADDFDAPLEEFRDYTG